jgi:SAM-dependent methyltransferase
LKENPESMERSAEKTVSEFYNKVGWQTKDGLTEDARRFEDLREFAREYVQKCRLRVLRHVPDRGECLLDMASGPIQYDEYLEYSGNFRKRYCVDLSSGALESAKRKIGDHGVFLCGSFLDIPLEENFFDCAISLHTIYHIDKDRQEEAVRKLVRVTRPGKNVVIVYSNPDRLINRLVRFARRLGHAIGVSHPAAETGRSDLYFFDHPLNWWDRFGDVAEIRMFPWRSLHPDEQKRLIPDNRIGRRMLDVLFRLEDRFPVFFTRHFCYPLIVLTKRKA